MSNNEWKGRLRALIDQRDETIADLRDQLASMTHERDYWSEYAALLEKQLDDMDDDGCEMHGNDPCDVCYPPSHPL